MDEMVRRPVDVTNPSDDKIIEGEFTTEGRLVGQASGYFCRKCEMPLIVGDKNCPRCNWIFNLPTPSLALVETRERPEFRSSWLQERTTAEEMERSRQYRKKRR